jgi:hypothetical protein
MMDSWQWKCTSWKWKGSPSSSFKRAHQAPLRPKLLTAKKRLFLGIVGYEIDQLHSMQCLFECGYHHRCSEEVSDGSLPERAWFGFQWGDFLQVTSPQTFRCSWLKQKTSSCSLLPDSSELVPVDYLTSTVLKRELSGLTLPLDEFLTKLYGVMGTFTKDHFTSAFQIRLQCSKRGFILNSPR